MPDDKSNGLYNRWNLDIAQFAAKDESRYSLKAILVEPDATVVTDGHQLVRVTTPLCSLADYPVVPGCKVILPDKPFLLPAEAAKTISKQLPRKATIPVLMNAAVIEAEDGQVGMVTTDLDNARPVISRANGGTFPKYENVMPKPDTPVMAKFDCNGELLAGLAKFLGQADCIHHRVKVTIFGEADKPNRVIQLESTNNDTGQEALALLMPLMK